MNNAERIVKINACIKATNNSIKLIKIVNITEPPATALTLKINGKHNKDNTKMWPAVMFANKRIINAKGLVNTPIISTGIISGFNHQGTGGLKICPQYYLFPLNKIISNVIAANTIVTAIFPVTLAEPGKNGTKPNTFINHIKKNTVNK